MIDKAIEEFANSFIVRGLNKDGEIIETYNPSKLKGAITKEIEKAFKAGCKSMYKFFSIKKMDDVIERLWQQYKQDNKI